MPIKRARTRWPASWAAMRSPRPTMATRMAMSRGSIAHASVRRRTYVVRRRSESAAFACAHPDEVVAQDLGVVEAERVPRDLALGEPARLRRVVGPLRLRAGLGAAGAGRGNGVLPRVAARGRVPEELPAQLHLEARLL